MIEFIIAFESVINYKSLHFTGIWDKKIYISSVCPNEQN